MKPKTMAMSTDFPTEKDILEASAYLKGKVHETPILSSGFLNQMLEAELYFKAEHLQKTGSFKARGALFALHKAGSLAARGVVTHSSGNHGQALAWAALKSGVQAHVVMPENAPLVKKQAVAAYGASIHYCESTLEARESKCNQLKHDLGLYFIPPYNDYHVICGQSTMMKECLHQLPDLDAALIPVGGGGLFSGSLLANVFAQSKIEMWGAEPQAVNDAWRSLNCGERQTQNHGFTIADGLRTVLGERNFPIIHQLAEGIFTAEEDTIVLALKHIYTYLKQAVEPSAAVSFAALLENRDYFKGKKVLLILCGGNVELSNLPF